MDRSSLDERMRLARERARKWKGEERRLEAIKRGEDRKRDTRRKIWAGGWLMNTLKEDPHLRARFVAHLRTVKFRKGEQELFADLLNATQPPDRTELSDALDQGDGRGGSLPPPRAPR